ncbi:MAG: hypothetical protein MUP31_03510 [Xanthomonadales bacterium]|nr:hypothetical protein [Xanthomonadales bacterium]
MKILIALLLFFVVASPLSAQQSMTVEAQREINISRKLINDKRLAVIVDYADNVDSMTKSLMQIESRMDVMVELKIAEGVPLMN